MTVLPSKRTAPPRMRFQRLPGLYRRWELGQVAGPGNDFHLEEAGTTSDGIPLFAVFRREPTSAAKE